MDTHEKNNLELNNNEEISDEENQAREQAILSSNDDLCFTSTQIKIIRALLKLAPVPSCKETKKLLLSLESKSIKQIYNSVFSWVKASNKELLHYLGVVLEFPHPEMDIELLVNLRLTAQDKYMGQTVHTYFALVDLIYDKLTLPQKLKIFYRYIYVFTSHACLDISLFTLFSKILEKDFLGVFLRKQFYANFPFFKEFIVRFSPVLGDHSIKIGYEHPSFRKLIYYCAKDKGASNGLCDLDWVAHKWGIPLNYSIPLMFYYFDCSPFLDYLALSKIQGVENLADVIKSDLKDAESSIQCCICDNTKNYSTLDEKVHGWANAKDQILKSVEEFNRTGVLNSTIDMSFIRLFPSVDLKTLGSFLCKEKNMHHFLKFTESFEFHNMNLLEAFRYFLSSFTLPGESQIIYRAVDVFSTVYVVQNFGKKFFTSPHASLERENYSCNPLPEKLIPFKDKCKKISYGFIVLNTMLFNPSFEKKPTFDDYLKLAEYEESFYLDHENDYFSFDADDLKEFYESIKETEMKIPNHWNDSFDKFLLFKRCLSDLQGFFPFKSTTGLSDHSPTNSNTLCSKCVKISYCHLFEKSVNSFMFLPPSAFFRICHLLDLEGHFKNYILLNRKDIYRCIEACKLYIQHFAADEMTMSIFIESFEKLEKPKASVLTDFRSMFSRSTGDLAKSSNFSSLSSSLINELSNIKFADKKICSVNLELMNSLAIDKKPFVKQAINKIMRNNIEFIDNFASLDPILQIEILREDPVKNMKNVSEEAKLRFLIKEFQEGNFDPFYYESFNEIQSVDQLAFEAFCLLQQKYDGFDSAVKIERAPIDSTNPNEIFKFTEKYKQAMSSADNIKKLFMCSNSVLNLKFAKKIHKDYCPVNSPAFKDFNKLVYLVLKCNQFDRSMCDYAACIMNYMSDSLPLLVEIYEYIYPVFSEINKDFCGVLMKILIKRVRLFSENGVSCCDETNDPSVVYKVKKLITKLFNDQILDSVDLKTLPVYCKTKPESFEL